MGKACLTFGASFKGKNMWVSEKYVVLIWIVFVFTLVNVFLLIRQGRDFFVATSKNHLWIIFSVFTGGIPVTIILCFLGMHQNSKLFEEEAKRAALIEEWRKSEEEAKRAALIEEWRKSPEGKSAALKAKRAALIVELTDISGVSDKIARTLMDQYPTQESIENASVEQLSDIPGVGESIARAIKARLG